MRQQIRQDVVAMFVHSRSGRSGIAAEDDFELRVRRIAGEIFIGKNIDVGWMINRQKLDLIEIHRLFQRLHEAKAELSVFSSDRVAINFDVLSRSWNVSLARPDPVPHHSRAKHVGHELVLVPIPDKKRRTRTAAAVDLHELVLAIGGEFDFILQNAGWPEHANNIGLFSLTESDS